MKNLKRIQVGNFNLQEAVTIEQLDNNLNNEKFFDKHFISIEKLFEKAEEIILDNRQLELFLNGVRLTQKVADGVYRIYSNSKFIGLGIVNDELLKRDIIIN